MYYDMTQYSTTVTTGAFYDFSYCLVAHLPVFARLDLCFTMHASSVQEIDREQESRA